MNEISVKKLLPLAGIGSLRAHLLPAWFGWISLVMTAGLLTPIH